MTSQSISSLSETIGANQSSVTQYLKRGTATISQEKKNALMEGLGIDHKTGTLKPGVHRWDWNVAEVPAELLEETVRITMPEGGIIFPIEVPFLKQPRANPIWILASHEGVCVVLYLSFKTKIKGMTLPNDYFKSIVRRGFFKVSSFGSDWLWNGGGQDKSEAKKIGINEEQFNRLIYDKTTGVPEIREMIGLPTPEWTWGRVMVMLQRQYPSAEEYARKFHLDQK